MSTMQTSQKSSTNFNVGEIPVPYQAQMEVSDMLAKLSELFYFKNGETAAFMHVCSVLALHLGDGKE